jgi:hypothetical protein
VAQFFLFFFRLRSMYFEQLPRGCSSFSMHLVGQSPVCRVAPVGRMAADTLLPFAGCLQWLAVLEGLPSPSGTATRFSSSRLTAG